MFNGSKDLGISGRLARYLVFAIVLAFGAAACSGDVAPSADESTTVAPDAERSLTALNAGLKVHANGDLAKAADYYRTTLEYDPTNKYAFYNLALIDEAEGNYGLAEDKYRSALETDGEYTPALFNLAILRTARNDPKGAIALYKRVLAADKKDAAAWLNLGLLLRENGHERTGDEDVLRALALDPSLKDPVVAVTGDGPARP